MDVRVVVLLIFLTAFAEGAPGRNNGKGNNRKKGGHGKDISNPTVDPDSDLENILESQLVFDGKKEKRPKHLRPYDKSWQREMENEMVIETKKKRKVKKRGKFVPEDRRLKTRNFPSWYTFESGDLWTNAIVPYLVDESSFGTDLDQFYSLLDDAKNIYHTETCVRFEPWTSTLASSLGHDNEITFHESGNGCWSNVGMTSNGKISVDMPGCGSVGTFFHEMGHTLGMKHEQSRSDRADTLLIKWKNIKWGKEGNFYKGDTMDHDSYDLYSRMQYGLKSFTSNGDYTIELRDPEWEFLTTASKPYSYYDIADVNKVYKCADSCVNPLVCEHFGYVNQNCECTCPDGLEGTTCNERDANCGSFVTLTSGETQTVSSPNWGTGNYDVNLTCVWMVSAPANHRIKVTITNMDVAWDLNLDRCHHWVELKSSLIGDPGLQRCGSLASLTTVEYFHTLNEEANEMMILFDSLYANDISPTSGFTLDVTAFKSGCLPTNPCKMGSSCTEGNNDFTYTCNCLSGYSGDNCDDVAVDATVSCHFEDDFGRDCFLILGNNGWTVDRNESTLTHADGGVFARPTYNNGQPSLLESGVNFAAGERCLQFEYANKEDTTGGITVFYEGSDFTGRREALVLDKTTGNTWATAHVDFPSTNDLKIIFEGTYGSGSVVAIDNVMLAPGTCGAPCQFSNPCLNEGVCSPNAEQTSFVCTCTNGYTGNLCQTITNETTLTCTFEPNEICSLEQEENSDELDWSVYNTQADQYPHTGPGAPAQGVYYSYVKTTWENTGDRAVYKNTERDLPEGKRCLKFSYHMNGGDLGTLNIKTIENNQLTSTVWTKSGSQGDQWINDAVYIPPMQNLNIEIESVRGDGWQSDIGIDNVILHPGYCGCASSPCPATSQCLDSEQYAPYQCLFDNVDAMCSLLDGEHCFLTQDNTDTVDFSIKTDATDGFKYWSLEPTGAAGDQTGRLVVDNTVMFNEMERCLTFFYIMDGATGTLNVNSGGANIYTVSGDKGKEWIQTLMSIPAQSELELTFEAVKSQTAGTEIAISDIILHAKSCDDIELRCNLEDDQCFLVQDKTDDADWIIRQGVTPSTGTGPGSALEGLSYIYMEASFRNVGEIDRLISSLDVPATDRCFIFYYHMYGDWGMGTLNVYVNGQTFLSITGDQGNIWHMFGKQLPVQQDYQIEFEAIRGDTWASDIAIDDVWLRKGLCRCASSPCLNGGVCTDSQADTTSYTCACPSGFGGTHCELVDDAHLTCTFEPTENICFLKDATDDDFDWTKRQGNTPSSDTGPSSAQEGVQYIFTEASSPRSPGDLAILETSGGFTIRDRCLTFYYHMYGIYGYMGTLRVKLNNGATPFEVSGDQADVWTYAEVDIAALADLKITIEGERGIGWASDIAIDNVNLVPGVCPTTKREFKKDKKYLMKEKLIEKLEKLSKLLKH